MKLLNCSDESIVCDDGGAHYCCCVMYVCVHEWILFISASLTLPPFFFIIITIDRITSHTHNKERGDIDFGKKFRSRGRTTQKLILKDISHISFRKTHIMKVLIFALLSLVAKIANAQNEDWALIVDAGSSGTR